MVPKWAADVVWRGGEIVLSANEVGGNSQLTTVHSELPLKISCHSDVVHQYITEHLMVTDDFHQTCSESKTFQPISTNHIVIAQNLSLRVGIFSSVGNYFKRHMLLRFLTTLSWSLIQIMGDTVSAIIFLVYRMGLMSDNIIYWKTRGVPTHASHNSQAKNNSLSKLQLPPGYLFDLPALRRNRPVYEVRWMSN